MNKTIILIIISIILAVFVFIIEIKLRDGEKKSLTAAKKLQNITIGLHDYFLKINY